MPKAKQKCNECAKKYDKKVCILGDKTYLCNNCYEELEDEICSKDGCDGVDEHLYEDCKG